MLHGVLGMFNHLNGRGLPAQDGSALREGGQAQKKQRTHRVIFIKVILANLSGGNCISI